MTVDRKPFEYCTSFKLFVSILFQPFPVGTFFVLSGLEIGDGEEEFGDEE